MKGKPFIFTTKDDEYIREATADGIIDRIIAKNIGRGCTRKNVVNRRMKLGLYKGTSRKPTAANTPGAAPTACPELPLDAKVALLEVRYNTLLKQYTEMKRLVVSIQTMTEQNNFDIDNLIESSIRFDTASKNLGETTEAISSNVDSLSGTVSDIEKYLSLSALKRTVSRYDKTTK